MIKTRIRKLSKRKTWGCPRTKNRSNWCFGWCVPKNGIGTCGRVAPHGLMGRTQRSIQSFNDRKTANNGSS